MMGGGGGGDWQKEKEMCFPFSCMMRRRLMKF